MATKRKPQAHVLFPDEIDPRCRELADHFLPADADEIMRAAMAQNIQDLVDDWLLDIRNGAI